MSIFRNSQARLTKIYLIRGKLRNLSPFLIGRGEGDVHDVEILKDERGNPFIPATSLIGALKSAVEKKFEIPNDDSWRYFWGNRETNKNVMQSHFIVDDAYLPDDVYIKVPYRDGVKIDPKNGRAVDQCKYDYELIEVQCTFPFSAELKIRSCMESSDVEKILSACMRVLESGELQLGAQTTKGFGRFKLENFEIHAFVFPDDGAKFIQWLETDQCPSQCRIDTSELPRLKLKNRRDFEIEANFELKHALMIRSYTADPNKPDIVHLRADEKPIISGSSLKGAIRARALRIVHTLGKREEMLSNLFGTIDSENKKKSRFWVDETQIENACSEVQVRIKIDRFTGGVIEGALVESEPLWHHKEEIRVRMGIRNFQDWEAGLILLVLKDLWMEDLPIGGEKAIGRGILKGLQAKISFNNKTVVIRKTDSGLDLSGPVEELEQYVQALLKKE